MNIARYDAVVLAIVVYRPQLMTQSLLAVLSSVNAQSTVGRSEDRAAACVIDRAIDTHRSTI